MVRSIELCESARYSFTRHMSHLGRRQRLECAEHFASWEGLLQQAGDQPKVLPASRFLKQHTGEHLRMRFGAHDRQTDNNRDTGQSRRERPRD